MSVDKALQKAKIAEGQINQVAAWMGPQGGPDLGQKLREVPGLFIRSGKLKNQTFFVETLPFRIGRGPNNHLLLPDAPVEPYHAVITRNAEGVYVLSAAVEGSCPLFVRQNGRYRPQTIIPLKDRLYVQIGQGGPRLRFRYTGRAVTAHKPELDEAAAAQPLVLHDLGPADLRRGLSRLLSTARLNEQERMVVDEAARAMNQLRWFRWALVFLTIGVAVAVTTTIFFQQRYTDRTQEAALNQKSWSEAWERMFIKGEVEQASAEVVSPEVALDPVTGQIQKVMESFGFPKYRVEPLFLRRVKDEIDKEVRRVKNADFEGFMERYNRFHPQIASNFERIKPPLRNFAYLAWVSSDYRLDLRNEKALGMWQFKPGTAERYGLLVDGGDYRSDFLESTRAAGEFLTDLVTLFGMENFMLVLASWQGGEARVLQAFEKDKLWLQDQREFERMCPYTQDGGYAPGLLPEDMCRFPMRFLAATIVGENMSFHLRRE